MVAWGPSSCSLGPAGTTPFNARCTLFDSGQTGVLIIETTGQVDLAFSGNTTSSWGIKVSCFDQNGVLLTEQNPVSQLVSSGTHSSWSNSVPTGTTRCLIEAACSFHAGDSGTWSGSGVVNTGTHCVYGTQLTPGMAKVVYVTPDVVAAVTGAVDAPWLVAFFAPLLFSSVDLGNLCGSGPPPMPTIDTSTLNASLATVTSIFKAAAWFAYCECKPGTPAPLPFPTPVLTQPTDWPAAPVFSCSNTDLCSALVAMQKQLASLQQVLAEDTTLTTLLQRYELPFAYLPGAAHSNQANSGDFAISRVAGMRFTYQAGTIPRTLPGNPPYQWDVGWMAIETADGLLHEKRITRLQQVWWEPAFALATRFSFFLNPTIVGTFTELEAEP